MKIATIIVRILVGAFMLFASITYFFNLVPEPSFTGDMKTFTEGLSVSKYLMPLAKTVELIAGLTIISGKFMKIGAVILVPVTLNILLINIFLIPEGIPIAATLFLGNIFLIYSNWNSYKYLFTI
ncbi:MAG: DoxX family membrane protein [Flavobacterium sp.]